MDDKKFEKLERFIGYDDAKIIKFIMMHGTVIVDDIEESLGIYRGVAQDILFRLCNLGILEKNSDVFIINEYIDDFDIFLDSIPFIPRTKEEIYNMYHKHKQNQSHLCSCKPGSFSNDGKCKCDSIHKTPIDI